MAIVAAIAACIFVSPAHAVDDGGPGGGGGGDCLGCQSGWWTNKVWCEKGMIVGKTECETPFPYGVTCETSGEYCLGPIIVKSPGFI